MFTFCFILKNQLSDDISQIEVKIDKVLDQPIPNDDEDMEFSECDNLEYHEESPFSLYKGNVQQCIKTDKPKICYRIMGNKWTTFIALKDFTEIEIEND